GFRQFLQRRADWKRELVELGIARWYGAFDGDQLVGSLGLVALGDVSRYQDVQVATAYRKRGIASALLATAAREVLDAPFVIVAQAPDVIRLYERAGFRVIE